MATVTWVKNLLDQRGVTYEETHHREAFTSQEVAQSEHVSGHRLAKVVVVMADGRPVELVVPASRRVLLKRVHDILKARQVRLASEAEIDCVFDDVETGAIPALRHWKGVEVLMDESMRVDGDILIQGGTHQDTLRLKFTDWFNMVRPTVASFSALDSPASHWSSINHEDVDSSA